MATRRAMIAAAQTIATMAWDEGEPLDDVADSAQGILFEAIRQRTRRGLNHISLGMTRYLTDLEERIENPVDVSGLKTGYLDLDRILNGLIAQRLYIVAGRPSMGKTALMLGMLDYLSIDHDKRGLVFSLEMSEEELINRVIAKRVRVDTQKLERGDLTDNERERVYAEAGRFGQSPIFVSDTPAQSPSQIRAECLKQDAETGIDYVLIDYLQLMKVPGVKKRYDEVSTIAREMKNLSKELDVPVVLLSQLNRSLEIRPDKRPRLSDLRDSGEIEEAADVVLFLYRDDYYNPEKCLRPNIGEVAIAKARGGPTGVIDIFWQAYTASYRNLERIEVKL
jgi:replicative DNA helicase